MVKPKQIQQVIREHNNFFASGATREYAFRIRQLKILKKALRDHEEEIMDALFKDFRKSKFESYASEIGIIYPDIDFAIKHLRSWMKPRRVSTSIVHFLSKSVVYSQPYGTVLIIGPWNYPFQLVITPLVGAIAAGNTAIVKPSELSPNTSSLIARIIKKIFPENYVTAVEGGVDVSKALLAEHFDYIFFTGGTSIGRTVMEAAAKHLTPVTLELGGKSPTIVDKDADLSLAAKRIAWGKFFNAGQTCLAPDYLLVHKEVKEKFLAALAKTIDDFYAKNPKASPDYARIINARHFSRLDALMKDGAIVYGGQRDPKDLFIAPTIIDNVKPGNSIMTEEIFGPVLPVMTFEKIDEVISFVNARPRPLALYYFSGDRKSQKRVLAETSSGGGCINDTVSQFGSETLPFGGIGESGMGSYHGKASFDTFTHRRSILVRSNKIDMPLRYPPYRNKVALLKRLFRIIG
ncbi:MAG: aldehyde dehydrogenase [Spirochaetes bacterium]|nr:MAG: aldehyde dehydrogenase [Spirochaetota bacterium]